MLGDALVSKGCTAYYDALRQRAYIFDATWTGSVLEYDPVTHAVTTSETPMDISEAAGRMDFPTAVAQWGGDYYVFGGADFWRYTPGFPDITVWRP